MVRFGIIGTSCISDKFVEALKTIKKCKVTAVYSRNLEKGKQFAAKYNVEKVYDNYEEMAKDPEIDAVYVPKWTSSITSYKNDGKWETCNL
mgnify:CR=1 FL=1